MKTRLIWANFVSSDLERTKAFYTALGFERKGTYEEKDSACFVFGENQFIINFFTEQRLSNPMNGGLSVPENANEIIFSLSADSKEELEQWVENVKSANGTIFSEIQPVGPGFTVGFSDPDNHRFNVLYWPGM